MKRTLTDLSEIAVVNTTGERVRVLRRRGVRHDEQIMEALTRAGHFVIGTPGGFRYHREGKRKFTRPEPATVYLLDNEGTATHALPGAHFTKYYTIVKGDDL